MANFTYADYKKFIEEITEAANKTFDMKEVANRLYNVHGIKKEIRLIHCYSGDKSPFLNVFLTKEGTFKFVSNFKNENEFNEATDVYSSQYFNEFEETVMRPFYAKGTIQPLSIDRITYDMVGIIMSADNYKLDSFTMGNEKHDYYNLPDYFIPLKKAKVLSVTKVKGSYDYRIRFRLTNKTFQIKYFTVATCNESSAFENSIKERVANGEDYPTVFADEIIKFLDTLTYIQEEIVPELKATIDFIASRKNDDLAMQMIDSLKTYVSDPTSIVGPIMYLVDNKWFAHAKPFDDGKPYVAYNRFTEKMTVHNVDKSNETVDYSRKAVAVYADNYFKSK